jgi:ribokinase
MEPKVVSIGSALLDLSYLVDHMPVAGESVKASATHTLPGGKGLLQGLAARRLGAQVTLVSAVGDDERGRAIVDLIEAEGIVTDCLVQDPERVTRFNLAAIDSSGDVCFVQLVHDLAATIEPRHIVAARPALTTANVILLSLETPRPAIDKLLDLLVSIPRSVRPTLHLNPGPAHYISERCSLRLLKEADWLSPNYLEAVALTGHFGADVRLPDSRSFEGAAQLARELTKIGILRGCITLGSLGATCFTPDRQFAQSAFRVPRVVDAIGASDAFIAAFAISLHEGCSTEEAVVRASAAGAHSVATFDGARGMPTIQHIEATIGGAQSFPEG